MAEDLDLAVVGGRIVLGDGTYDLAIGVKDGVIVRPVAGVHQMGVAVDQAGGHPASVAVDHLGVDGAHDRQLGLRAGEDDAVALDQHGAALDDAEPRQIGAHGGEPRVAPYSRRTGSRRLHGSTRLSGRLPKPRRRRVAAGFRVANCIDIMSRDASGGLKPIEGADDRAAFR